MNRLEPGSQIGRYRILRRLGAGAMGEVYLAEDPQIGRQLAIKTVLVEEGRPQEIEDRKKRLLREARAAGKLLHPNIVALFDAGEDRDILYLAFEFIDGTDLERRVTEGTPLTLGETLAIVRQAAEGLDYAHRQGVVHRDIKPSNLMLTADGRVKIADFGIAKVLDSTSDLTMTGSVVGSPHYLSPEQIRGDALDGRTDIFSLGILLYELLCRQRPFDAETLTTLVYQILHKEPAPLAEHRPDLSPRLTGLVHRMMDKDRDQRFANAAELVAEIAACERELSPALLAGRALPEREPTDGTIRLPQEASTALRAGALPPPPPPPPSVVPPPPPPGAPVAVAPPPVTAPPGAATATAPRGRLALVLLVAAAVLVALVMAGLGARRFVAKRMARAPEPVPSDVVPANPDRPVVPAPAAPAKTTSTASSALDTPSAAVETPREPPPFQPGERPVVPRPAETSAPATPAPREAPKPAPAPAVERRAEPIEPKPAAPEVKMAAPAETAPAEPEPEGTAREVREALVLRVPVAREMATGMSLSLEMVPKKLAERVVVRFDRIVIGRAADWNAKQRGGRAYAIADEGLHILTFLLDGADVYRIRIDARAGNAGPTPVVVDAAAFGAGRPRGLG